MRSHGIDAEGELGPLFAAPSPDVDSEVLKRLRQMYEAGGWVLLESTIADLPADLRWLYESGAVTIEQLSALHAALGVTSAADLAAAAAEQHIRALPAFDAAIEHAVTASLPALREGLHRLPLGRAVALADPFLTALESTSGVAWASTAGSLRRGEDTVGDIEIVASAADPTAAAGAALDASAGARRLHVSDRKLYVLVDRVQIGVRLPEPSTAGVVLAYLSGTRAHFETLQRIAVSRGLRLTSSALTGPDGPVLTATETELYAALGLPWVPPEVRAGGEELTLAERGALPALLSRRDIRGDLHMHTEWSDGRDSIDAMVDGCRALGYEYMAITDHSPHSAATRNLTLDGVKRQADEIARLRDAHPDIAILHGCEVDILPDGRLDFPDRVLERFDIVLASLHDGAGHSPDRLLHRYEAAMKHPLVSIITHPTNRLLPGRSGYALDYPRLFELAVETGAILEVDGAPAHLDLDGALARQAIGTGAMIAVDSDCHRAEMLDRQMQLGVTTARRGWAEPRHVLNTRPIDGVRDIIGRKRSGR